MMPAYTFRPHLTEETMDVKLLSMRRMSEACRAMEVPDSIANPTSDRRSAGASFVPSPARCPRVSTSQPAKHGAPAGTPARKHAHAGEHANTARGHVLRGRWQDTRAEFQPGYRGVCASVGGHASMCVWESVSASPDGAPLAVLRTRTKLLDKHLKYAHTYARTT